MYKLLGLSAIILIILFFPFVLNGQQNGTLEEINKLFNNREYQKVVEAYEKLLKETTDVPTRAKIKFNLGMTFQMLRLFDKSIDNFNAILAMDVDDREPGGHIMEIYRNYRPRAQWEIGNSLFGKGDYAEALEAFRLSRTKRPINTGCGTCNITIARRYNIVEGITLEALGRYSEAVVTYLKADEPRLAEIYFKAGQIDDLREFVNKSIDDLMRKHSWNREYATRASRLGNLKIMIDAYDLEKSEDWKELFKLAYRYANLRDYGGNNIPVTILARHTDKLVPQMMYELRKELHANEIGVIYEILALSETDDSITLLKSLISKNGLHWENALILIRTLNLAGDKGKRTLDELEPLSKNNLKIARDIRGTRDDLDKFGRFEIKFPRLGQLPKLPGRHDLKTLMP